MIALIDLKYLVSEKDERGARASRLDDVRAFPTGGDQVEYGIPRDVIPVEMPPSA